MSKLLIGLCGYYQSGKDHVAKYLTETRGWYRDQMSADLWELLLKLDPYVTIKNGIHFDHVRVSQYFMRDCKGSYEKAKEHPEIRRLLQKLGTECGWMFHGKECWWKPVEDRLKSTHMSATLTGLRFDHEINGFKKLGGVMVWVNRPSKKPDTSHISEHIEWVKKECSIVLNNDRENDLDYFHARINDMVAFIEGGMQP